MDAIYFWNDHLLHDGWCCRITVLSHQYCLTAGGADLVSHGGEEGLDEEGSQQETTTDEEVESVDEGPALLRSQCEHQEDAVCRQE